MCPIFNLCLSCPGHTHLETGEMDGEAPYFCEVAHARARMLTAVQSSLSLDLPL